MANSVVEITDDLFETICLELECGKSLKKICELRNITYGRITALIARNEEKRARYVRAREVQADFMADAALAVYDGEPKLKHDQFGNASIDPAWVQMQKNIAEQMKWHAAKMKPKVYGDSTTVKGDKDNPLFNFANALDGARAALAKHRDQALIEDKNITIEGESSVVDSDSPL